MNRKELPMSEIVEKYENGTSMEKLGEEYGVSKCTINNRLKEYYEEIGVQRPVLKRGRKPKELPIEEVVEKHERGTSISKLASEYKVSYYNIQDILREYYEEGEIERPILKKGPKKRELPTEEMVEKYKNGISIRELSEEYGVSYYSVQYMLRDYYKTTGIKRPVIKRGPKKKKLPTKEVIEKYEQGITMKALAKEYGVVYYIIQDTLREYYEETGNKRPSLRGRPVKKPGVGTEEIIDMYENGISADEIATQYHLSIDLVRRRLKKHYESKGTKPPRILKSIGVIEEYLKKGLTVEEIIQIAKNKNIVISKELIDTINNMKAKADDNQRDEK